MGQRTITHCCECRQPIISGEDFVCFKIPGKENYHFFHCRVRASDCWDRRLKQGRSMPEQNGLRDFEQEVLPHLDAAYNLARWLTRNDQDAQDVVQEAYLRAL